MPRAVAIDQSAGSNVSVRVLASNFFLDMTDLCLIFQRTMMVELLAVTGAVALRTTSLSAGAALEWE